MKRVFFKIQTVPLETVGLEYADCFSSRGVRPRPQGMLLLPGPLWLRVIVPVRILYNMGKSCSVFKLFIFDRNT